MLTAFLSVGATRIVLKARQKLELYVHLNNV
jgi:hypothetical protein